MKFDVSNRVRYYFVIRVGFGGALGFAGQDLQVSNGDVVYVLDEISTWCPGGILVLCILRGVLVAIHITRKVSPIIMFRLYHQYFPLCRALFAVFLVMPHLCLFRQAEYFWWQQCSLESCLLLYAKGLCIGAGLIIELETFSKKVTALTVISTVINSINSVSLCYNLCFTLYYVDLQLPNQQLLFLQKFDTECKWSVLFFFTGHATTIIPNQQDTRIVPVADLSHAVYVMTKTKFSSELNR